MNKKDFKFMNGVEGVEMEPFELSDLGMRTEINLVNERGEKMKIENVCDWLLALAAAVDQGWNPNGDSTSYATHGRVISQQESRLIVEALEKVIMRFESNIMNLRGLINFLGGGAFRIDAEEKDLSH